MYFKLRTFKYRPIPRTHHRRCMIRFGRVVLILLLIWTFIFIQTLRKNNHRSIQLKSYNVSQASIAIMINNLNSEEKILNTESYGNLKEDTTIIVVLVDGFSKEFNTFLASLSKVRGMEDVFIIFSHYYYDEMLNNTIQGIDFSRVLQIFYPYSVQSQSREFSGFDLNDCTAKGSKTSQRSKCTDAYFLDIYGHYQNGKKHQWWWTANHIFERLKCTKHHTGLVIFMKDDLIFTKDFIYMAMYMKSVAVSLPRCEFISMGTNSVSDTDYTASDIYSAELTVWDPNLHSSVLAFDVTAWNIIAAHYDLYCDLTDISWSRSLYYISSHRMDSLKFKVLSSITPRAFKISPGTWFCDVNTDVDILTKFEDAHAEDWFPPYVELYAKVVMQNIPNFYSEKFTETADPRDRALCYNLSISKIKKTIMTLNI